MQFKVGEGERVGHQGRAHLKRREEGGERLHLHVLLQDALLRSRLDGRLRRSRLHILVVLILLILGANRVWVVLLVVLSDGIG
jgi:hypothetical protein